MHALDQNQHVIDEAALNGAGFHQDFLEGLSGADGSDDADPKAAGEDAIVA
jgi:hypothetical protein